MEQEGINASSMKSMNRRDFTTPQEDDGKEQLSSSSQCAATAIARSEPTTVYHFPRIYSHEEIDKEIFNTLCMNDMEIS